MTVEEYLFKKLLIKKSQLTVAIDKNIEKIRSGAIKNKDKEGFKRDLKFQLSELEKQLYESEQNRESEREENEEALQPKLENERPETITDY